MFLLHWAGNLPCPSLFQLSNWFMENCPTEPQAWFHKTHDLRALYFNFYSPTLSHQDFPSSSCSRIWPELQPGLQPFPRLSPGWILGLFVRKYSCRSILGSGASLKDDTGCSDAGAQFERHFGAVAQSKIQLSCAASNGWTGTQSGNNSFLQPLNLNKCQAAALHIWVNTYQQKNANMFVTAELFLKQNIYITSNFAGSVSFPLISFLFLSAVQSCWDQIPNLVYTERVLKFVSSCSEISADYI